MSDQELERVKQILVGDLRAALDAVEHELEKKFEKAQFSQAVASVVAEALEERTASDDKVSDVLAPTIDQAITGSIDQDPKKLAESLYPIMGPAIRKSISETLQQMLENFNQLLEESLSPKSLRWRFDAWRTGRSYSELVMLNTLEYRIEQVFVIHRETSLLIQHQLADLADAKDPDMVSSMFSAIQDFIEDSFSTDETNELNTLRLGDLTVVIQRGPAAIIAAVVRGRVPENLRADMVRLLESMHIKKRALLAEYSGDPDDFLDLEPDVRKLLQAGKKEQAEKKFPWPAVAAILVAALAFGYWQWLGQQLINEQRQQVAELAAAPGIVLLNADYSRKQLAVEFMADPDSVDPAAHLNLSHPEYTVLIKSVPYLSMQPEVIAARAERILTPAANTRLEVADRKIILTGAATAAWLEQAERQWPRVSGAEALDFSQLTVLTPRLDAIKALITDVESTVFQFETGSADLDPESPEFQILVRDFKDLLAKTNAYGASLAVDIVGYTDTSGTERVNRIIALNRAETLKLYLIDAGIPESILTAYRGQDYEGTQVSQNDSTRETHLVVRMTP